MYPSVKWTHALLLPPKIFAIEYLYDQLRSIAISEVIVERKRTLNESSLKSEVRKVTAKIQTLLSSQVGPEPVLNRHCPECEFQLGNGGGGNFDVQRS
jgi:hypothetical protein